MERILNNFSLFLRSLHGEKKKYRLIRGLDKKRVSENNAILT